MRRRKQNGPRKRTGCEACKNSHVKCTEEKPSCRRCQRLRLECGYEFKLLWEEDALQRNIVHGRAGVWSRDGRKIAKAPASFVQSSTDVYRPVALVNASQDWQFVNVNIADFENGSDPDIFDLSDLESIADEDPAVAVDPQLSLTELIVETEELETIEPPSFILAPYRAATAYQDVDAHLLSYYVQELSPKCSLSIDLNPYLNILLPIAFEFEPLRHALLAAAASELKLMHGDQSLEVHLLRHRSKAIKGLRCHIETQQMDWKSLATMAMFCFRDISDDCEPTWITHLKMGLRMLKDLRCTSNVDIDLRHFCEMYLVAHDVMGRTAWEDDTDIEHYDWERDEYYEEIDAIMGCSRELISLISRISFLAAKQRQGTTLPTESIAVMACALMGKLSTLQQVPRARAKNVRYMTLIAEVKRLSAMLYLHDKTMAPWIPGASGASDQPSTSVKYLQDCIIQSLKELPVTSGAALWPLFVLGSSTLETDDQKGFVLSRLHQLEKSRNLGSVYHARRRVERSIMASIAAPDNVSSQDLAPLTSRALNDNERWVSLA